MCILQGKGRKEKKDEARSLSVKYAVMYVEHRTQHVGHWDGVGFITYLRYLLESRYVVGPV